MSGLKISLACTAALLFGCSPQMRAEHADFTGAWVLDAGASTFSSNPPTAGTLTVEKHGKTLHLVEAFNLVNGDMTREFDWKIDDKFHPVDSGTGGEVLAKWDHGTLIGERRTGDGQNKEAVRMTARDANTLTETIVRPDSQSALVWRRR